MTDTYPSGFPGLKIGIKRTIKDATTIQQAATKAEHRFSEADELPMEWGLDYTLRQSDGVSVDELAQVLAFYEAHRGPADAFNFADPYDNVTRLARFEESSLEAVRVLPSPGWYEVTVNLKSLINPAAAAPTRPLLASLVYPFDIPGREMEITRETLWEAKWIQGASLTEAQYSHQAAPVYRWSLAFEGRTSPSSGVNEVAAMENWFRYYRGRLRPFAFVDPVDGISKAVRFDSDLAMERTLSTWWKYEVNLITCLNAPLPVTSVIITSPTS